MNDITNQLFSLTGEGSGRLWTEEFPPMPIKRTASTALCTGTALIVAGGTIDYEGTHCTTVEVLSTKTLQWSTAADLPQCQSEAPAAVCSDHVYILGNSANSMYTCSVLALIQSCQSRWKKVAAPPVKNTTCVSIHGRLLAIGGEDSGGKLTSAVYIYNLTTNSWEVISHMGTPRQCCIAAVLPNNQLMVVGGQTDSVELGTIE